MKKHIILTVGISNSGKTTWAEEYATKNNYVNLNRDDYRSSYFALNDKLETYKFSKAKENTISKYIIADALKSPLVIISDTNLNPKTRDKWKLFAEENDYKYEEKLFEIEPHIAKIRNIKRSYYVPESVIDQQYISMRKYLKIDAYKPNFENKQAIIFDLDGTLASMEGIRKPYEWKKCIDDKPRNSIIGLLDRYSIDHDIIIMSGRDSICYYETIKWLEYHNIKFAGLFMRKVDDHRSDPVVKEELFYRYVADKWNVKFVVDDRNRMVNHWRAMGLECWQVQAGAF